MKKEKKIVWTNVLNDDDIAFFTTLMFDFMEGKVNFNDLIELGKQKGYIVKPNIDIALKNASTDERKDTLMKKIENNTITYRDVKKFILSNNEYDKILMHIDRIGIGIAANYGDKRAIFMMQGINKTEYNILHGKETSEPIYDDEKEDFMKYVNNPSEYIEEIFNKKRGK